MPTQGVSNIGTVTDKGLNKEKFQELEQRTDKPEDGDAKNFNNILEKGIKDESKVNLQGDEIQLKQAPENLGDRILNAFQGMKENIDQRHQKVDSLLNNDEMLSMKDMFKTQKAMTNLMMTEDLIAKVVGKSTQSLETLMKQQ